jgi:CHAT domain-containing protein/tetratricopeptide (TPR) repeat protein
MSADRPLVALLVAALVLVSFPSGPTWAADPEPASGQPLTEGASVERDLAPDAIHPYRLEANAGDCLRFDLEQKGLDVALKLIGPDDKVAAEFHDPGVNDRPESWSFIAASAGAYRLEVRAPGARVPGPYSIRLAVRREATADDRLRVGAESSYLSGQWLVREQKAEKLQPAVQKYEEAIAIFAGLGDLRMQGRALWGAFNASSIAGLGAQALAYALRVRAIRQQEGDRRNEGRALAAIADAHMTLGDMERAREALEEALRIDVALGDPLEEGWALARIGALYAETGEPEKAQYHLQRALSTFHALGDPGQAKVLLALGVVYERIGEHERASQAYAQALPIYRASGDRVGEGLALNNVGEIERLLGDPRKAIEYYTQAHALLKEAGFPQKDALVISNIGRAHQDLDELEPALLFLEEALVLSRKVASRSGEAITLQKMGEVREKQGALRPALELYRDALRLFGEVEDRLRVADVRREIADVLARLGETEEAIRLYEQTLAEVASLEDRKLKASTLHGLARALMTKGRWEEAQARNEEALVVVESMRAGVIGQERRASFLATKRNYYEFQVDLLMERHGQGPPGNLSAEALRTSERARGRGLLEILSEARTDLRKGVDPALVDRERALQRQLNGKAERLTRLLGTKHRVEQEAIARAEVESLLQAHKDLRTQIRAASPGYAALTQPVPLTLAEIQDRVLDEDSLLLEYALGAERSYVWAVTRSSMESHVLPGRTEIEALARRVLELLEKSDQPEVAVAFRKQAAALSRMILGPVAQQLGRKRLVVVAEGALQYVSFAALPSPSAHGAHAPSLVVDHEIVSLPSASALDVLRRQVAGRMPATGLVAVLADPVLDASDPRVRTSFHPAKGAAPNAAARPEASDDLARSAADAGVSSFERLRWSRTEARSIIALGGAANSLGALDFAASRATAQGPDLGSYRIVHFATHGLLNSQHPELSGIVLSLVDERGQPQDGFLRLHEIYNLELNADLVVLSACRTALGKDVRGEGLVGLTRGFWYAGAPRVVASLWDVRDRATAELMGRFYRAMLKEGRTPAAALRAAQVSMSREKRWEAPYYWAGFVLQGEWR